MADYDSDSSGIDEVETNVLLGFASGEPTGDDFSQLGGHPSWLDHRTTPSGVLAKCKVCDGLMALLLQLNADLPDKFSGHERRLYILACRRKACRRRDGSVRGFRADRYTTTSANVKHIRLNVEEEAPKIPPSPQPPRMNIGETLFGVQPKISGLANPFTTQGSGSPASNPFAATTSLAAKPAQRPTPADSLSETFAQKVKISTNEAAATAAIVPEPAPYSEWPEVSLFQMPYPRYYLDADKEYIEPEPQTALSGMRIDPNGNGGESSDGVADEKAAFESNMDKTFQRFADRLSQNPLQVLRYEYAGQPLLYSKTDPVGKLLSPAQENTAAKVKTLASAGGSRIPRCTNCGAQRVFELQLTPHAITDLEADMVSVDAGMEWGTVIMAVCSRSCTERGKGPGEVGYTEEWIGVQWEEVAGGGGGGSKRS